MDLSHLTTNVTVKVIVMRKMIMMKKNKLLKEKG